MPYNSFIHAKTCAYTTKTKQMKQKIAKIVVGLFLALTAISLLLMTFGCSKKTSTFESVSTRDSMAVVTLPGRSLLIMTNPCDSNGNPLRWGTEFNYGGNKFKVNSDQNGIVVSAETPGDTSTNVNKSESEKETITKIVEVTPDWAWWLLAINAAQLLWWSIRKRVFTFLNNK